MIPTFVIFLTACVDVWDTGKLDELPRIRSTGWVKDIYPRLCNSNFRLNDGMGGAITAITLLLEFEDTTAGPHSPDRLILVMYNPTRYLKILID